jgi:hypothetical protein
LLQQLHSYVMQDLGLAAVHATDVVVLCPFAPTGKRSSSAGMSANQLLSGVGTSSKGPLSKEALAQDWKQLARGIAEAEATESGGGAGSGPSGSSSSRIGSSSSRGAQEKRPWKQRTANQEK